MNDLKIQKIIFFFLFFAGISWLSAHIIGINNRFDDVSSFGFVGIKGDFSSVALNPSTIISTMPKKDFSVCLGGDYTTKPSYFGYIGLHPSSVPFPVLLEYKKGISENNTESFSVDLDKAALTMGWADPTAGTSLTGGVSVKYIGFSKTMNHAEAAGQVFTASVGLTKQIGSFRIGTAWHTGGKIKWNINTVLENAVPCVFNASVSWTGKQFSAVAGWNHIFPARSYVSYYSTKQIILREGEDRYSLTSVIHISQNMNVQVGADNLPYDLIDNTEINGILIKVGLIGEFNSLGFQIIYIDNAIIGVSDSMNKYRYISASVNYNFSL